MDDKAPVRQVVSIPVAEIRPNPRNPRGIEVRERDPQFEQLRASVRQHGILVPLIVARDGETGYLLIDGERRWHVARSLRLGEVPAYVFEEGYSPTQIQELMFHIHMNRLQWDAATQCAATEPLYEELKARHGNDFEAILVGDFNTGDERDREVTTPFFAEAELSRLVAAGWTDAWRSLHPETREFSWYSQAGNGFLLDHAYLSPRLRHSLLDAQLSHREREGRVTDHSALIVDISIEP